MKIYRVAYYNESDSSQGFEFFSTKLKAEKALADYFDKEGENYDDGRSGVDSFEFDLTKKGVLELLNVVAVHEQNG